MPLASVFSFLLKRVRKWSRALSFQPSASRPSNETGSNWPGSDEVYVTIHVPGHAQPARESLGNVDAGETMHFPRDQRCIFPIAERGMGQHRSFEATRAIPGIASAQAASQAPPSPIRCFPSRLCCARRTVRVYHLCLAALSLGTAPDGEEPGPIEAVDDLIGRREVVYSREELIGMQVHQTLVESVSIRPPTCPVGQDVCEASDTAYLFTWSITRVR